jgi:hypothetical protein
VSASDFLRVCVTHTRTHSLVRCRPEVVAAGAIDDHRAMVKALAVACIRASTATLLALAFVAYSHFGAIHERLPPFKNGELHVPALAYAGALLVILLRARATLDAAAKRAQHAVETKAGMSTAGLSPLELSAIIGERVRDENAEDEDETELLQPAEQASGAQDTDRATPRRRQELQECWLEGSVPDSSEDYEARVESIRRRRLAASAVHSR